MQLHKSGQQVCARGLFAQAIGSRSGAAAAGQLGGAGAPHTHSSFLIGHNPLKSSCCLGLRQTPLLGQGQRAVVKQLQLPHDTKQIVDGRRPEQSDAYSVVFFLGFFTLSNNDS